MSYLTSRSSPTSLSTRVASDLQVQSNSNDMELCHGYFSAQDLPENAEPHAMLEWCRQAKSVPGVMEAFDIHNFGPQSFYQDAAVMKSNTPKRTHLKHAATEKKVT